MFNTENYQRAKLNLNIDSIYNDAGLDYNWLVFRVEATLTMENEPERKLSIYVNFPEKEVEKEAPPVFVCCMEKMQNDRFLHLTEDDPILMNSLDTESTVLLIAATMVTQELGDR